jgi:serine/threonine protein kinase
MDSSSSNSEFVTTSSSSSTHYQSSTWVEDDKFFKTSKHVDFVAENETMIGKILNNFGHQNIVKFLGNTTKLFVDEEKECTQHIPGVTIEQLVTIWEKLDPLSLAEIIDNEEYSDEQIASCVCQVILCILELQDLMGFVHGDLHTSNVLISPTDQTFLKYFNGNVQIPSNGLCARLIDFGNSCVWKHNYNPEFMSVPLYAYSDGVVNMWFDPLYDIRVFCEAVAYDLFNSRKGLFVSNFQCFTANILSMFTQTNGKVVPSNDVYENLILFLKSCIEKEEVRGCCDAQFFADMFGALIAIPIEEKIIQLECLDFNVDEENNFIKFYRAWLLIEKYFTKKQAEHVFKNIVNFVRENIITKSVKSLEGDFNKLIHEQLQYHGQNMVAISFLDSSILLHSLIVASTSLINTSINHILLYKTIVADATQTTLEIMSNVDFDNSYYTSIPIILANWYNNI